MKRSLFLLALLSLAAPAVHGAGPAKEVKPPPTEKPEEVAHTYIRAMADLHLNVVADSMHPSALASFQNLLTRIASGIEAAPADRKPPAEMVSALFGENGLAKVKSDPAREVFVRFMNNLATFVPQIREMTGGSEYQVIGHVDEGDFAHVVFRATLKRGEISMTKMEVLTLQRDGDSWKVLLTDELATMVSGLGRQLMNPPPPKPATPAPAQK